MHLRQKSMILENVANFLDHDLSLGIIHTLFSYSSFYIEVLVEYETNELIEIVAFTNGERLDKYVEHILWEDLF